MTKLKERNPGWVSELTKLRSVGGLVWFFFCTSKSLSLSAMIYLHVQIFCNSFLGRCPPQGQGLLWHQIQLLEALPYQNRFHIMRTGFMGESVQTVQIGTGFFWCSYRIRSSFWKFYLIRIGFTLREPVLLVNVFRLLDWNGFFLGVQSVDTVGRCMYNILAIGRFVMPCFF